MQWAFSREASMRRIVIIAAAAATLLSSLAFSVEAQDRGRDRDRGDDRRYEGSERRGDYERGRGRYERGDGGRSERLPRYEPRPEVRRREDPRNAPPPYYGAERSWRQGERLPPMYRGRVVRDPGRFRLRAPPPGYDWIGVGPDIYLMQRSTGLVLDAIPGGY
jgi:Ni/Co efflux regulator RcnB